MSFSLHAGMPETTSAAIRVVKGLDREPLYRLVPGDDQLGYALAVVDNKRFIRQVNQNHTYFAAIVGVYRPRRIQQADAFLQSEARARPYLRLIARRQRDEQPRGHHAARQRRQFDRGIEVGPQVHTGTQRCGVCRQSMVGTVDDFYFHPYVVDCKSEQKYGIPRI